jgi:hypothetical protein
VNGQIHMQGTENFWSLLKRGLRGTYVVIEPFRPDASVAGQESRFSAMITVQRKTTRSTMRTGSRWQYCKFRERD